MRVPKVRKSGVDAEKKEIRSASSSLFVKRTRKTRSGITRKLYPVKKNKLVSTTI